MKRRIKKCFFLFVCVLAFTALGGLLSPNKPAQTTGNRIVTEKTLIPGGQSVGIQMDVKGALIVGVENQSGPKVGDMIVAVNGEEVDGPQAVIDLVGRSDNVVELTVVRDKKRMQFEITPYYDEQEKLYKLGLWIKEKIAGIGTLTYYDSDTETFASLGHGIYEPESGVLLEAKQGNLLHTKVNQVKEGKSGQPGELGGVIYDFEDPIGEIETNSDFGIYGKVVNNAMFEKSKPLPVASVDEIEKGAAVIQSTISGTEVETYHIEITEIHPTRTDTGRGLEFRVTDQTLLDTCGGIVQGMSGSPIIQDGKLVGAVTHVLVNDPTRGYGIFVGTMLEVTE